MAQVINAEALGGFTLGGGVDWDAAVGSEPLLAGGVGGYGWLSVTSHVFSSLARGQEILSQLWYLAVGVED